MILVSGVAHHLMYAGGVDVAHEAAEHVRVVQAGIAGEMNVLVTTADGEIGGVDGDGAHVGDVGSVGECCQPAPCRKAARSARAAAPAPRAP